MKLKGAQIVIETLIEQGVDLVFGYPGGTVLDIYDELYKNSDRITHVITCHEQGAAHAADGYARSNGKVGVVIATSGPGATNLVTGIATANIDSTPLVAITGNVSMNMIGKDSFQEVDITGVTIPVTKHNFMVKDINDLADTLREAFIIAKSGRPGAVLVDIPKNIQQGFCEYAKKRPAKPKPAPVPETEAFDAAARLINESERPFIYVGGGVVIGDAVKETLELVDKLDCPLGATMMGMTAVPWDHRNFTGMMGMHGSYASSWAVSEADLVIAVGTRFSDRVIGNKDEFAKKAKVLHIDIDEAEVDKNILSYMSLTGDIKQILAALAEKVGKPSRTDWNKQVRAVRTDKKAPDRDKLRPWDVLHRLWEKTGDKTLVATDVGQHQMWTSQSFKFSEPRTFITSGGLGTMGFGMGAAMGAYLGKKYRTILITSDGSFHMNMNELATMVSYNLPIIIIVMNNNALGMVKQWQNLFYDKRFSNTVLNRKTDYVKLAEAFGASGLRLSRPDELDSVLDAALNANSPVVIDCVIDGDEFVLPMIPPGGSIKNMITERVE